MKRFGFKSRNPDEALHELEMFLKQNAYAKFVVKLLRELAPLRRERVFEITDIYITEGRLPKIGQPTFPLPDSIVKEVFSPESLPQQKHLFEMTKAFYGDLTDEDLKRLLKEGRGRLEFSFAVYGYGSFRCILSRGLSGYSLTIRWLDFSIPGLEGLGYHPAYEEFFRSLVNEVRIPLPPQLSPNGKSIPAPVGFLRRSGGLILHCGPTGSGKTTSMVAEFAYLADRVNGVFLTYENPIEYPFIAPAKAHLLQYDIDRDFYGSFESLLKHLLRNNPTAVMIGEARSRSELAALVDVASRGHLVFATMHAGNFLEALEILVSLEDVKEQLALSLLAIVSHRLVRLSAQRSDGQSVIATVPLYEFFIPSASSIRNHIRNGDMKNIVTELQNMSLNDRQRIYISFYDSLKYFLSRAPLRFTEEFGQMLQQVARNNSAIKPPV